MPIGGMLNMECQLQLTNLDLFTFFLVLSCADKRWYENFTTILTLEGHKIEYRRNEDEGDAQVRDQNNFVDGIPIDDLIKDKDAKRQRFHCSQKFRQKITCFQKSHIDI